MTVCRNGPRVGGRSEPGWWPVLFFDLLRSVRQTSHTTFLIVTHDHRLAKRCDRIIELVDGQIHSDTANVATREG